MNITRPWIQRLILVGVLLLTLQPLYGLQTNMEQFREFELMLRSEGRDVPEDTQFAENQWGHFLENLDELEKFGEIESIRGREVRLLVRRPELTQTVNQLLDQLDVVDLTISDPPIDEIIGKVFKDPQGADSASRRPP